MTSKTGLGKILMLFEDSGAAKPEVEIVIVFETVSAKPQTESEAINVILKVPLAV